MARRVKLDLRNDAVCRNCKEDMDYDISVPSVHWAWGIAGVRFRLCSVTCAMEYAVQQRERQGLTDGA